MTWQYVFPSNKALETTTNTTFNVKFGRNVQSEDDIEISPIEGSKVKLTAADLTKLKSQLWVVIMQSHTRSEMRCIVEKDFSGDRHWVAYTLSDITKKSVSNRTVQAWLMDPDKPSSRTCPEWALQALKTYIAAASNSAYLEEGRKHRESDSSFSRAWAAEVDNRHSVNFATNEILGEERRLREWQSANFNTLPVMINRLEDQTQKYLSSLSSRLCAIESALEKSTSFEDFKSVALAAIRDKDLAEWLVKDARRAIENRTGEFASEDGVVEKLIPKTPNGKVLD